VTTTLATSTKSGSTTTASGSSASASATGKVQYGRSRSLFYSEILLNKLPAGVNIAGFDFGCGTDGSDNITDVYPPLSALGGPDGVSSAKRLAKGHPSALRTE
jgi:endoglucanase